MSALPPKADIHPPDQDVCFGPKADFATSLFDYPVRHSTLTLNDDKIPDRAVQSKSNYLLVLWRSVPSFSSLSRREFDNHETRVLPFPFQ
jgi:hypothetical protein